MSASNNNPKLLKTNLKTLIYWRTSNKSTKQYLYCKRINTPATTKVDEWTKEEIGVGALIADKSQELNGNWALFTELPIIKNNNPHFTTKFCLINKSIIPTINNTKNINRIFTWQLS